MGRVHQSCPFYIFSSLLIIISNVLIITRASPVVSLPLRRHRNPFINQSYTATLAADATRVNYLHSRLWKSPATVAPQGAVAPLRDIYVASVALGPEPSTEVDMVVDTGSDVSWIKCSPCDRCTGHVYNTSRSSTYRAISCNSPQDCISPWVGITCQPRESVCSFNQYYGDGSAAGGEIGTETVSFLGYMQSVTIAIGCAHDVGGNVGSFDGIIGLGPDPISFPNQLKATSFSYCFNEFSYVSGPNSDPSSSLDFNTTAPEDSVVVGMFRNQENDIYYYVNLTGITIGEDHITVPPEVYEIRDDGRGGVVLDSGTALTHLDSRVYDSFFDAFKKNAQNLKLAQGYDKCYDIPGVSSPSGIQFPAVSFQFPDEKSLELGPENIFQKTGDTVYCLAFESASPIVSIIGNIAQQGMRVTYNLESKSIAFSPKKC